MAGLRKIEIKHKVFLDTLNDQNRAKYDDFLAGLKQHIKISKYHQDLLLDDFNNALIYYIRNDVPFDEALRRLDYTKLGGFYANPSSSWYPLDNAAIVYPLGMKFGHMPVFRMSAYLKEDVVPELLQMALNFTIKRFPVFATTIKRGFFWHYMDSTKRRFDIQEEVTLPCAPISVSGTRAQSFRVMYFGKRISVEYFHILTDGTGGLVFLKTLVGEYLKLLGHDFEYGEGVLDISETPKSSEMSNEFAKAEIKEGVSGFMGKKATQMSGKIADVQPAQILHFEMDAAQLLDKAHSYGVTLTAYLLGQMFLAEKYATESNDGEARIQVPVNMRKFNGSDTLRNYSMYFSCDLALKDITTLDDILPSISQQLKEKSQEEEMNRMMSTTIKLIKTLRFVPLAIKRPVLIMVYGFLGDKIFSNYLSNVGVVRVPKGMEQYIDKFDFLLGINEICRAACSLITFNNKAVFTISKSTSSPAYEEKLYQLLTDAGIDVEVTGSQLYEG